MAGDQMILFSLDLASNWSRHSHTLANLPYFVIQLHGFEIPNNDLVVVFCDSQVISKGWDALALGSGSLSFVQRGHRVFWINFQKPDAGNVESLVKYFTWSIEIED